MYRGVKAVERNGKVADELAPYRRLVELQKQVSALAKQNEKARQECAALRERMAAEVIAQLQTRRTLARRLRDQASRVWRRLPRFARDEPRTNAVNGHATDNASRQPN